MKIEVEAYAGYKAAERPMRFRLGERWLAVEEVVDRWYDPDAVYFKIRAEDGDIHILRYSEPGDSWTLESFRKTV